MNLHSKAEALYRQGDEKGDNAALNQSIGTWHLVLQQRPRDRVPLDWAMSTGNQGVALMMIAERLSDVTKAQSAVQQIDVAFATMRDGGDAPDAAYYKDQLSKAQALLDRLNKR